MVLGEASDDGGFACSPIAQQHHFELPVFRLPFVVRISHSTEPSTRGSLDSTTGDSTPTELTGLVKVVTLRSRPLFAVMAVSVANVNIFNKLQERQHLSVERWQRKAILGYCEDVLVRKMVKTPYPTKKVLMLN